jgi:aquaporin NIP
LTELRPELARLAAELIGTFALVFVGCGAIMVDAETGSLGQVGVALAFGLVIAVMVAAAGPISGGHFNPAVTLALWLARELPGGRAAGYAAAQVAGALAGAALLRASLGDVASVGATQPSGSAGEAFLWELVLTFFLLFVIAAVATGARPEPAVTAGLAVGGTIAMASLAGGPVSGASLNPARSLGPALVSGELGSLWVYLTAPPVGGVLGAFAYLLMRRAATEARAEGSDA